MSTGVVMRTRGLRAGMLALVLCSCSSSSTGTGSGPPDASAFSGAPLVTATSASGKLHVEVRTSPEPPAHGNLSAELTITDMTTGAPQDGLVLSIVPWMPSMGHGTSVVPVVTAAGSGNYVVTDLVLFMAGHWELRTATSGPVSDSVVPALDLP